MLGGSIEGGSWGIDESRVCICMHTCVYLAIDKCMCQGVPVQGLSHMSACMYAWAQIAMCACRYGSETRTLLAGSVD